MTLKKRVEIELKKQKRSLSWLALKIEMTVDGLRGSLVTESIKYSNIVRVCEAMGIKTGVLFGEEPHSGQAMAEVPDQVWNEETTNQEVIAILKEQLRDKERIIELLSK